MAGPIRGELLGAEHLAERARTLAATQRLAVGTRRRGRPRLLARLQDTARILGDAHDRLAAAADREADVSPAGEWLLDNFHVVQEHIREVNESLPRGYYRELPELAHGGLVGYPRIYEIATTIISHSEGRIDLETVQRFVGAFQEVTPLSIGELWAMPAMLRLGLLESVRRMALRTVHRLEELDRADAWAARLVAASETGAAALASALNDFVSRPPALTPAFVARFVPQARAVHGELPPLVWLERWIAEEGVSVEDAAARSTQRVALTQITMANSITSLRAIGGMQWRTFVERQSAAERRVAARPGGSVRQRAPSRLAMPIAMSSSGSPSAPAWPRSAVAQRALDLAREAGSDPRRSHVGCYLVDAGLAELERAPATGLRPGSGFTAGR